MKKLLFLILTCLPIACSGASAPLLLSDLTYYVDPTNGVDTASGLSWSAAKRTIQSAVNAAQIWNFGTNTVTIRLTNGTYFGCVSVRGSVANTDYKGRDGVIDIVGNGIANTLITGTNGITHVIVSSMGAKVKVRDFSINSISTNVLNLLDAQIGGYLSVSNINFGMMTGDFTAHIVSESGGLVSITGPTIINNGANAHFYALMNGSIWSPSNDVSILGTPNFSSAFALADTAGTMRVNDDYTGSATGMRFYASSGGAIYTPGITNPAYFPGDIAGVTDTGGQYTDGFLTRVGGSNLVVSANGNVGIGTTNPLVKLDVTTVVAGSGIATSVGRISRVSNPPVLNDGVLFGFRFQDGASNGINIAAIGGTITQTNAGSAGGVLTLLTKAPADASTQVRVTVQTNGNVTITGGVDPRASNLVAPATVAVGSSPTSYTNTDGYAEAIFVDAGTVSAIAINGTTVFTSTGKTVELQNNEYVTVTYTGAPTIRKKPL